MIGLPPVQPEEYIEKVVLRDAKVPCILPASLCETIHGEIDYRHR